jgi:hypothetical protein
VNKLAESLERTRMRMEKRPEAMWDNEWTWPLVERVLEHMRIVLIHFNQWKGLALTIYVSLQCVDMSKRASVIERANVWSV